MYNLVHRAIDLLREKHNPHTMILYGSYARREATESSDIDIACFIDDAIASQQTYLVENVQVDAWIYPSISLDDIPNSSLRFADGLAVLDTRGLGATYIERVKEKLKRGPDKLSEPEFAAMTAWVGKMLRRAQSRDMDGSYRRTWLQFELLEIYFKARGLWFLGHKKSFSYLARHDPEALSLFHAVYQDPGNMTMLERLAEHVLSLTTSSGS